ncbi:cupin domain-containing protein [Egicoccus sp. AB-alg2]|uniref:cupin domain-containing protein n=1 Tax=Egicoccus sp. AB-alg2 TaxID=3242693 RepID=UPI00359D210E
MSTVAQKPQHFTLRTPYLVEGRSNTTVARTDQLAVRVKVYAKGGENALHAHQHEDHTFVVLEGQATFYDANDDAMTVGPYEGILLPRGIYYRFESTGEGNLVLLRVGTGKPPEGNDRVGTDGHLLTGDSAQNKKVPPVPAPDGLHFGDPA